MHRIATLLLLSLVGCRVAVEPVRAPFELDLSQALWVDVELEEEGSAAVLLLGVGSTSCQDLVDQPDVLAALRSATWQGRGLMLRLEDSDGPLGAATYASGGDSSGRALSLKAFSDGHLFELEGRGLPHAEDRPRAQLTLDELGSRVSGQLTSRYWGGAFDAERCGSMPEPPGDTGPFADDSAAPDDSGEGCEDCPLRIQSVGADCDAQRWWFDVEVQGRVDSAQLYVAQTGVAPALTWLEHGHRFPESRSWDEASDAERRAGDTRGYHDPEGRWDHPYMELLRVDSTDDVSLGVSTLFACDDNRMATLTWAIGVRAPGGEGTDCFAWGHDPSASADPWGFDFSGCRR